MKLCRRSLLCLLCLLSVIFLLLPASAEEAVPSAACTVTEEKNTVTLTLLLSGKDLCRTQCAAFAYDRTVLSLPGEPEHAAPDTMLPLQTDSITPHAPWSFSVLPVSVGMNAEETIGYLFLYPHTDTPAASDKETPVCTVSFVRKEGAVLSESSIRLITAAEQNALAQSVKLLLCDSENARTFGSLNGGDTLADPVFSGNTAVTGKRDEPAVIPPDTPWSNPFTDVPDHAPYYDAVAYVCRAKLFIGSSPTTFSPEEPMNRATFATVLCRLAGAEEAVLAEAEQKREGKQPFSDVAADAWYTPYVLWAADTGLFLGDGNGCFHPDQPITHEQMYVLMERFTEAYGYAARSGDGVSLASVADAGEISPWAASGVRFAFANRLLVADDSRCIRPTAPAARWELATLLKSLSHIRHE